MTKQILTILFPSLLLAANHPAPVEADFTIPGFKFSSGETLPELRIHYRTVGKLDGANAVLILHGTGGSGEAFLREQFAGQLFGPGQLLDATRYFLILPDNIGHGRSSKPSDGLRTKFPRYGYTDMVEAQRRLGEHLGVKQYRLIAGTSMGCMHAWVWGVTHPGAARALLPLACLPHEISGRNIVWRKMIVDGIRADPAYQGGNYTAQPRNGIAAGQAISVLMGRNTIEMQESAPTREAGIALHQKLAGDMAARNVDANDMIYQFEASHDYNPRPGLEKVTAAVYAVNFADDPINPPELRILEREIKRVRRGKAVVMPATKDTRGHGTHSLPVFWKPYLEKLLRASR